MADSPPTALSLFCYYSTPLLRSLENRVVVWLETLVEGYDSYNLEEDVAIQTATFIEPIGC